MRLTAKPMGDNDAHYLKWGWVKLNGCWLICAWSRKLPRSWNSFTQYRPCYMSCLQLCILQLSIFIQWLIDRKKWRTSFTPLLIYTSKPLRRFNGRIRQKRHELHLTKPWRDTIMGNRDIKELVVCYSLGRMMTCSANRPRLVRKLSSPLFHHSNAISDLGEHLEGHAC